MDYVSGDGVGLGEFAKKVLTEVLLTSRAGLLVDLDQEGRSYLTLYSAENIINWGPGRVVLFEPDFEEDANGEVKQIDQYVDMHMADGAVVLTRYRRVSDGPGKQVWKPVSESVPTRHGRPLERMPWIWLSSVGAANRRFTSRVAIRRTGRNLSAPARSLCLRMPRRNVATQSSTGTA